MLHSFWRVTGRTLVVVASEDKTAATSAEAFLGFAPPGSASAAQPRSLQKVSGEYGSIVIFCSDVQKHLDFDMSFLQCCLEKLRPGGALLAHLGGLTDTQVGQLERTSLFAGAEQARVSGQAVGAGGGIQLQFSCRKPNWATGAVARLGGAAGEELIDDSALLGEVPEPMGKGKSDCSKAKKACANCSCGRKELEDKVGEEEAKKRLEQGTQRSSCGSCYLGDAFRCESCPYRGLPAFKPGSKVELSSGETEGTGQFDMREDRILDGLADIGGKLVISAA